MKQTILPLFLIVILTMITNAHAISGTVIYKESGCDSYIVKTENGYSLIQTFSGNDPEKGDELTGDYQKNGFSDAYNVTTNSETRVWVDDYALPKSEVVAKYSEKCN